jgi:hypothetical protein
VEGFPLVTTDDRRIGRLVGMEGDHYIVESGLPFRKSRFPLPKRYVSVDRERGRALAQVSKETLCGGPKVGRDGAIDEAAVAAYYGD